MTDFIITFYISNLFLAGIILILIIAKKLLAHTLSTRMQYLLWVFMFVLLAAPFLPIPNLTSVWSFSPDTFSDIQTTTTQTISSAATHTDWLNDFSLSISRESPSWIESLLWGIWISGIGCMIFFLIRSRKQLQTLKDSGYLIRDSEILALYKACLEEANIRKNIPLYGTDKFPSPVITDILHPRIYLPTHLVKDYHASELRYMLLHELQHYKYKDNLIQLCANFIHTLYWFNPCIWYAMKEMRIERELACDTAVLAMLDKSEYHTYGHTLINFSEKVSFSFMPFAAGISSDMKQMKKRILTIANYQTPSVLQKIKGHIIFMFAAVLLLSMAPELSIMASDFGHYDWDSSKEKITYLDLSDYYQQYDGCFVLYDVQKDSWCIYNKEQALTRVSPDSTYKIYDALLALESGVITPENSWQSWDGTSWPFTEWNQDQTLQNAMASSVNWYFQNLDNEMGKDTISDFLKEIQYGNENVSGSLSSYWMENSLKISPLEQVLLLHKLYDNSWDYSDQHIQTIKDAIYLTASSKGSLYGKTGTGQVENENVNGWFIGYIESTDQTYLFASQIQAKSDASGSKAAELALDILSDMQLWSE